MKYLCLFVYVCHLYYIFDNIIFPLLICITIIIIIGKSRNWLFVMVVLSTPIAIWWKKKGRRPFIFGCYDSSIKSIIIVNNNKNHKKYNPLRNEISNFLKYHK